MAEFCHDCIQEFEGLPASANGLRHKQRGDLVFDVCEGCGPGWFDWEGKKQRDDDNKEEDPNDHRP